MFNQQQLILSLLIIIAAIILSIYAYTRWRIRHLRPTALTGSLLLWCAASWMIVNAFQMLSSDIETAAFWTRVQFIPIAPVSTLWLFMALQFTSRDYLLTRRWFAVLAIIEVILVILALTSASHTLFISNVRLDFGNSFGDVKFDIGPGYIVFYLFNYLQVFLGAIILVRMLYRFQTFRWQGTIIILSLSLTVLANILDLSGRSPLPHLNLTPIVMAATVPIFVITLTRTRQADLVGVARGTVFQIMHDAVLVLDFEERILDANVAAERLVGQPLNKIVGRRIQEVWPEFAGYLDDLPLVSGARKEVSVHLDNVEQVFDLRSSNYGHGRGENLNRVLVLRNISNRVTAENALRLSEEYFRALTENASDIVFILSNETIISYASSSFMRAFEFPSEEISGSSVLDFIHRDDLTLFSEALLSASRQPGVADPIVVRFRRKDGCWLILECIPNNLAHHPSVRGIVLNARDVTERSEAEERLKKSLDEKELLLKEIHHRVKNNLQIVSSLLNLQLLNLDKQDSYEGLQDSISRIRSMALVHESLYRSDDLSHINMESYLRDLTTDLLQSYRPMNQGNITIQVVSDEVRLGINSAIPCALIVNELVSNSLKHAFSPDDKGQIRIEMRILDQGNYGLSVNDTGKGFPADIEWQTTTSLGLQLVRSLTYQLGGDVELENGTGTTFNIHFPSSETVEND